MTKRSPAKDLKTKAKAPKNAIGKGEKPATPYIPAYVKCAHQALVPIAELKPNPQNPNRHPQSQIERFAKVLNYTGVRKAVVVSKQTGFIVTGHGTTEAMRLCGFTEAPVDYQDFADYDQEFAHMVADNALQAWSDLDRGAINAMMADLGPDLDLEMFGMQDFAVDLAERSDTDQTPDADNFSGDGVHSDTVRKIVLFYSIDQYNVVITNLNKLVQSTGEKNLSDLVASLVEKAVDEAE